MADTKKKIRTGTPQKFFFDAHCFDDGYVEEVVPVVPPPPVFSEQELAAAKKESYDRGRKDALAEAHASREKQIADLVGVIAKKFDMLFIAEGDRESRYENEAVMVAKTIFEKLFPALNARHGLEEVAAMVEGAMQGQRAQAEIIIEVRPDFRDSIEDRLKSFTETMRGSKVTVTGNDKLGPGECRMNWNDGGGRRDVSGLAQEIHRQLEHMLADKPTLQDNRDKREGDVP